MLKSKGNKAQKYAVISLSGGMDSGTLMLRLLVEGYQVLALSFDYGQKHKVELQRAQALVEFLKKQHLTITHQIITLDGLSKLLRSNLIEGGGEVPEGHYHSENMHATIVPNRNKIFSSIMQAVALSISKEKSTDVVMAMGIHSGDHYIYPDCRQLFRDKDYEAFVAANWNAESVQYYLPYISINKGQVLADGLKSCLALDLNYQDIYSRTFTSYKPIIIGEEMYSDYRSASSIERIEAFISQKVDDPLIYADRRGVVDWLTVQSYVLDVIKKSKKNKSLV